MTREWDTALARGRRARRRGERQVAARELNRSFEAAQQGGDRIAMGRALVELGLMALDDGEVDAAATSVGRGLELVEDRGDDADRCRTLLAAARVALAYGDAETAVRLSGAASGGDSIDDARRDVDSSAVIDQARVLLGPDAVEREWARGVALEPPAAVALARARCGVE